MNVLGGFIALFVVAAAIAAAVLALNGLAIAFDRWPFIGVWLLRSVIAAGVLFLVYAVFMFGASVE